MEHWSSIHESQCKPIKLVGPIPNGQVGTRIRCWVRSRVRGCGRATAAPDVFGDSHWKACSNGMGGRDDLPQIDATVGSEIAEADFDTFDHPLDPIR